MVKPPLILSNLEEVAAPCQLLFIRGDREFWRSLLYTSNEQIKERTDIE